MRSLPRRGDVCWWEAREVSRRPVVVLSRNTAISARRQLIVAPCTSNIRGLRSDVLLEPGDDAVPRVSAVNLDAVSNVHVGELTHRLGRLSDVKMLEICRALAHAVDCQP